MAWVESQPIHKDCQQYKVIDAALGIIERGSYQVADAVAELPWLPNGPIPLQVTWTRPRCEPGSSRQRDDRRRSGRRRAGAGGPAA